jgi:hypothetical protein
VRLGIPTICPDAGPGEHQSGLPRGRGLPGSLLQLAMPLPGLGPRRGVPRTSGFRPWLASLLSAEAERVILALVLAWPTWGPDRSSAQLDRPEHDDGRLTPVTISRCLRRAGLQPSGQRLAALEVHNAQAAGLLTERTRRALIRAQRSRSPHVAASQPDDLSAWPRSTS